MVYNDVVTPAQAGTTNAKHGGGVVLTPGINIDQVINAGKLVPVSVDEPRLTNRFDDTEYYGAAAEAPPSGPSSSTKSPGTITDLNNLEFNWTSPENMAASDNQYATATFFAGNGPEPGTIRLSNFGFAIPADKTIVGIVLEVERKSDAANAIKDGFITLRRDNVDSNNKGSAVNWSTTEGYVSYGANNDLWGLTWTPAQINSSGFAVNLNTSSDGAGTAYIDHVRVTVYYQ